jgi:hypothetical protein
MVPSAVECSTFVFPDNRPAGYMNTTGAVLQVLALPDWGRQITKERLHGDFGRAWEEQAEAEAAEAWAMLETPAVTKALGGVIARLQGKAKAAKL